VRILVVDDAEPMRFLLGSVFRSIGHDVVTLASGTEVEAALAAAPVDVVFTDVVMPDSSGWDVLRHVRDRWPTLPVVFMTGWDDAAKKSREGLVPDAVLEKPFSLDKVRATLDAVAPAR
jgi:DNA-binding response OmpR family regulator